MVIMSDIDNTINNLKRLTKELAEEIKNEEYGRMFDFCKLIFSNLNTYVIIIGLDEKIKYMNPSLSKYLKSVDSDLKVGDIWYKNWDSKSIPKDHPSCEALKTRTVVHKKLEYPKLKSTYDVIAIPLIYNGISGTICLFNKV